MIKEEEKATMRELEEGLKRIRLNGIFGNYKKHESPFKEWIGPGQWKEKEDYIDWTPYIKEVLVNQISKLEVATWDYRGTEDISNGEWKIWGNSSEQTSSSFSVLKNELLTLMYSQQTKDLLAKHNILFFDPIVDDIPDVIRKTNITVLDTELELAFCSKKE